MKDNELQAFETKYGYKPTAIPVAVDALAVFVHKDNPIKHLTMEQVDAIFSSTRLCGAKTDVKTWGDLGVTGDLANKPVQLFGRNSVSGTYGYFKEEALCKRRLQAKRQRTTRFGFGCAIDQLLAERRWLLGHRLQDRQRENRSPGQERQHRVR